MVICDIRIFLGKGTGVVPFWLQDNQQYSNIFVNQQLILSKQ